MQTSDSGMMYFDSESAIRFFNSIPIKDFTHSSPQPAMSYMPLLSHTEHTTSGYQGVKLRRRGKTLLVPHATPSANVGHLS